MKQKKRKLFRMHYVSFHWMVNHLHSLSPYPSSKSTRRASPYARIASSRRVNLPPASRLQTIVRCTRPRVACASSTPQPRHRPACHHTLRLNDRWVGFHHRTRRLTQTPTNASMLNPHTTAHVARIAQSHCLQLT